MSDRPRVAIIGLGFGAEFIPIYQNHPDVELGGICQRTEEELNETGDQFEVPVSGRFTSYEEVLAQEDIDAVHINTPIELHAEQSLRGLAADKHVACTVPMATDLEACRELVRAEQESEGLYMMMETVVYSREYLFVEEKYESGQMGRIQFLRGSHQQDMSVGWPEYWWGFPPMHYGTHAVSPLFKLAGAAPEKVTCYGSGRIREEYVDRYGSPFAIESALFSMRDSDLACEATRSLFETTRQYRESFDVYGEDLSFEWQLMEEDDPVLHTGGEDAERVEVPDYGHRLPEEIAPFTTGGIYEEEDHLSFFQGGGHGGSHPHLVHEFVRAIVEERKAEVDAVTAAGWTGAGICAHTSAMKDGETVPIPDFARIAAEA